MTRVYIDRNVYYIEREFHIINCIIMIFIETMVNYYIYWNNILNYYNHGYYLSPMRYEWKYSDLFEYYYDSRVILINYYYNTKPRRSKLLCYYLFNRLERILIFKIIFLRMILRKKRKNFEIGFVFDTCINYW